MKGKSMRSALPPTQLRNWSRGHMSCWVLTPARAIGATKSACSAFTLNRNHQPDQFTPTPTSSQEFLPAHRALSSEIFPAEETFKLKLGPRHKVSLCTVSYILNFPGKVSVETSPACGCNKRPGAAQSQPPPAWRFLRRSP